MDDARSALAEAMTGVPGSLSVPGPAALLAYVEAEGQGTGAEAWDYLPAEAVEAFRWAEWVCYGGRYAHRSAEPRCWPALLATPCAGQSHSPIRSGSREKRPIMREGLTPAERAFACLSFHWIGGDTWDDAANLAGFDSPVVSRALIAQGWGEVWAR